MSSKNTRTGSPLCWQPLANFKHWFELSIYLLCSPGQEQETGVAVARLWPCLFYRSIGVPTKAESTWIFPAATTCLSSKESLPKKAHRRSMVVASTNFAASARARSCKSSAVAVHVPKLNRSHYGD